MDLTHDDLLFLALPIDVERPVRLLGLLGAQVLQRSPSTLADAHDLVAPFILKVAALALHQFAGFASIVVEYFVDETAGRVLRVVSQAIPLPRQRVPLVLLLHALVLEGLVEEPVLYGLVDQSILVPKEHAAYHRVATVHTETLRSVLSRVYSCIFTD